MTQDQSDLEFDLELKHLKSVRWNGQLSKEVHSSILRKLVDISDEVSCDKFGVETLNPGSKLVGLTSFDGFLVFSPNFPVLHPSFQILEYEITASEHNLRIMNRMSNLTKVKLQFDIGGHRIRSLFDYFLTSHEKLVDIKIHLDFDNFVNYVHSILRRRANLKHLMAYTKDDFIHDSMDEETDAFNYHSVSIDWNLMANMRQLRTFDLSGVKITNRVVDMESFYDSLPKLKDFRISSLQDAYFRRETRKYLLKHPERSIVSSFDSFFCGPTLSDEEVDSGAELYKRLV